jgi:hypothetical protein
MRDVVILSETKDLVEPYMPDPGTDLSPLAQDDIRIKFKSDRSLQLGSQ